MKTLPDNIRIGTCSWKYDSWKGLIYSDTVGKDYLREYAQHYNLVEVDQWFWSLFGDKVVMPKPDVVAEYAASVPDNFRFSVKVPNSITLTHQYQKGNKGPMQANPHFLSPHLLEDFLQLLDPIAGQIDSLIFQFEYLNKQKMAGPAEFLRQLEAFFSQCPPGYRYCIELRNKNYFNAGYFDFLEQNGLYHVFLQGYWMPSIFDLYDKFKDRINDFTVIRLHGPDRKSIEQKAGNNWNQILEPKDGEIEELVAMINDLSARQVKASVNVNNHYEGSAPLTIERITTNLFKRNGNVS